MESFEEFKQRKIEEDPEMSEVTDAYLRNMYQSEHGTGVKDSSGSGEAESRKGRSYSTLMGFAKFISAVGWVVVVLAIAGGISVGSLAGEGMRGFGGGLVVGVGLSITGILIVVQGQLVSCIVDIQRNTERMVGLMREE
jgi:hypothetical protein